MTTPLDDDKLIIRGRILSRTNQPRFREVSFHFGQVNYDEQGQITRLPEQVTVPMDQNGRFDLTLYPSTNDTAWVVKATFTDYDGRIFTDYRTMPPTGIVDFFKTPKATSIENVRWPNNETPLLISDLNKPGGPLQLTDNGTISNEHIPGDFLRVNDERIPELVNYVTWEDYETDQQNRTAREVHFSEAMVWEYDHGLPYKPGIDVVEEDGSILNGGVTYPIGTTKVVVEFDAPTSGTMIIR